MSEEKLAHLRHIVRYLEIRLPTTQAVGDEWLRSLQVVRGRIDVRGIVSIRKEAGKSLYDLADAIYSSSVQYRRGTTFTAILDTLTDAIFDELVGREPDSIVPTDLNKIEEQISAEFKGQVAPLHLYIPCRITRVPGTSFAVGPISFTFLSNFLQTERNSENEKIFDLTFTHLLSSMNAERAFWMATVDVEGCTRDRAWDIGDLSVDIALFGLQLAIPLEFSARMSRLTARTLPVLRDTISRTDGNYRGGSRNEQPALGMGLGTLEQHVRQSATILESVGNRVGWFLAKSSALPRLEQAWCDAAYWCHEAFVEPLDTIAVPKLETAIEVLLRAENTRGSKARFIQAIETFFGLKRDQFINPTSSFTVEKLAEGFVRDRSRILHGTWSTLDTHLKDSRPSLAELARRIMANYTVHLDDYMKDDGATDNIHHFLRWVAKRHPNP